MTPFRATLGADVSELIDFRRGFGLWLHEGEVSDDLAAELVLAAHEAVANAVQHSDSTDEIKVRASIGADGITIDVTDRGRWTTPDGRIEDNRRGLELIRGLTDQVLLCLDESGTTLKMRHSLEPPARMPAPS